jgi:hypothetical protein
MRRFFFYALATVTRSAALSFPAEPALSAVEVTGNLLLESIKKTLAFARVF